ncbi:MAG: hypothetical protein ABS81_08610 [Pseudonocardia sp. SCN 72-86]|nr:MAG: hypothetical protein ABS81_08610 [Pseudonocardia sp. SCN 72-86]
MGGTGPTGPPIVSGLVARGHDVTVFHTGQHEVDLPDVPHLHGSPFSADGIASTLGERTFDTVIATYGRVRLLASHLAGRCGHFVAVGGVPVYAGYVDPSAVFPSGVALPVREDAPRVAPDAPRSAGYDVAPIRRTEDHVFALGSAGGFKATYLRYPTIYGPRNPYAWEWNVVRRVLDGRRTVILADGGHGIHSRMAVRNAAEAVLLAVAEVAGGELEIRSLPWEIASPGRAMSAFGGAESACCVLDTTRLREDLGYRDVVGLREGMAETVEWMLANEDLLRRNGTTDPFDYAAEDRLLSAYDAALASLSAVAEPFRTGIGRMKVPQTAKGSLPETAKGSL